MRGSWWETDFVGYEYLWAISGGCGSGCLERKIFTSKISVFLWQQYCKERIAGDSKVKEKRFWEQFENFYAHAL